MAMATLRREKRSYADSNAYEEEDEDYDNHTYEYYVIEGDKISMAEWGDYIGIAVSSTDFPVIGQVYPHFYYDPDSLDNRRRYVVDSETNIICFSNVWADQSKVTVPVPKEEDIQEQNNNRV